MDFRQMSCTKVRIFLDEHKAKWMIDNLEARDVTLLYDRVRKCDPASASKIYKVMIFIKEAINGRR